MPKGTMQINVLLQRVAGWTASGKQIRLGAMPQCYGKWAKVGNVSLTRPSELPVIKELVRSLTRGLEENSTTQLLTLFIVPYYSVSARNIEDIQASVKFANEKDLYLVTKNTGHDQ